MCLFQENCKYSIKKILTYTFSLLAIYLAIFTDREIYEILLFIAALLGIRGYERVKLWATPEPDVDPELTDDSMLGGAKKKSGRKLLTD